MCCWRTASLSAAIGVCALAGPLSSCAGPRGASAADALVAAAVAQAVTRLDAPPAAVRVVDAPGLNVEDLTARLRDTMDAASGVDTVDEVSVRRELAACVEAPCPDTVAAQYRDATFIVASSVSRVGASFLATVRVQQGARELVRASAQSADAREALVRAGADAGGQLRRQLIEGGAAERAPPPPAEEAAPAAAGGGANAAQETP